MLTKTASVPRVYSQLVQDKLLKDELFCICSDNESPFNVIHDFTDLSQLPLLPRGAWRPLADLFIQNMENNF